MNNQIQLVLKSSTTELSLNDHELGIYLVPELDGLTGLPEIRTTSGVNSGYDGGWTSAQHYDARSITIRGVIANTDVATVERLRKQLVSLAGQGKQEELTLDLVTEAGNAYTLQVRTIALEMAMKGVLEKQEFMLQLRADDPLIYDNAESTHEAYIQVSKATGGFTINFDLPLAITGGSEETVISNDGLEQVPTITRLYGALRNPKIINQTTNQSMQINADLGFSEGQWVDASDVVTGKTINIEDAPDNAPLASFRLDGETSQQTYTGKNLFNLNTSTKGSSGSNNAVSPVVSNSDLTITQTGNGGNGYVWFEIPNSDSLLGKTVSISVGSMAHSGTTSTGRIIIYTNNLSEVANFSSITSSGWSASFSFPSSYPSGASSFRVYAYLNNANTTTSVGSTTKFTNIQLELGSSTSSYEPYVGGTASPNPDYPQAVQTVTGANVVKISDGQGNEQSYEVNLSLLPAEYQEVEYIESSAVAGQAINLKYYSTANTRFEIDYMRKGSMISAPVFGARHDYSASDTGKLVLWAKDTTSGEALNFGSIDSGYVDGTTSGIRHVTSNIGGNLYYNGTQVYSNDTAVKTTDDLPLYMFAMNSNGYAEVRTNAIKLYSFKLYEDTTLTADLVPCYRVADNVIGLYDLVRHEFYQAIGANTLSKGPNAANRAIELCKIGDYQDYIYKSGDKWYVHKETAKVSATSSDFSSTSASGGYYRAVIALSGIANSSQSGRRIGDAITNLFHGSTTDGAGAQFQTQGNMVVYTNSTTQTYAQLMTIIDSSSMVVYYTLATPTDTEITNETLVTQLETLLNTARTYAGVNNIFTVTPNEQGTLEISYYTHKTADNRDEIVIDSRLRTVTLNGLDIYHLIETGSEFLMLAPGENKLSLQSDITGDNGYAEVSYKQGYLSI